MTNLSKALVILAAVAFILAVVGSKFVGNILGTPPEAYSRACTNLALLAVGVSLAWKART